MNGLPLAAPRTLANMAMARLGEALVGAGAAMTGDPDRAPAQPRHFEDCGATGSRFARAAVSPTSLLDRPQCLTLHSCL